MKLAGRSYEEIYGSLIASQLKYLRSEAAKLAAKKPGWKLSFAGRHHTPETKQRISQTKRRQFAESRARKELAIEQERLRQEAFENEIIRLQQLMGRGAPSLDEIRSALADDTNSENNP